MSQIIIRGTKIEEVSFKPGNPSPIFKIKCRANWSETVCEAMAWSKEPQGFGNGNLEGQLLGISMILEPSARTLKDYRFDMKISSVGSFRHLAKTEDEKVVRRELEFVVTTIAEDAAVVLANYVAHCGPADDAGQCKITYSAEEQGTLTETPAEGEADKPRGRRKEKEAEAAGAVQ